MLDFTELPIDGTLFEQLIRELLIHDNFEVHWTGVGPDRGRDLIVIEKSQGPLSMFERKWLINCKHFANSSNRRSVHVSDLIDIIGDCNAIGAKGFLLACSTQPSSSLLARFEELQITNDIKIKYWDSIEIEKRLKKPNTFSLIHQFFPVSSNNYKWNIYNSSSPSLWAANYRHYFFYLSCRISNQFPSLDDCEEIVNRIEEIKLNEGQFLRPRAIYYDNKHEQYFVFIDYLYPRDEKRTNLHAPSYFNKYLKDGMGLYSNQGSMWNITFWSINYIPSTFHSDHFDFDHREFYEKNIENYKFGNIRNSITELDKQISGLFHNDA